MRFSLSGCILWHFLLVQFAIGIEYCPSGTLVIEKGLQPKNEEAATNAHNRARQSLVDGLVVGRPRAKYMKTMIYDQILAHKATPVSKQCTNNTLDVKDKRWPCVAQHIYLTRSETFDPNQYWDEAVNYWFFGAQFQQMAWSDMDTFGCDFYLFIGLDDPNKPFNKMYTCNYGCCAISGQLPYPTG